MTSVINIRKWQVLFGGDYSFDDNKIVRKHAQTFVKPNKFELKLIVTKNVIVN